MGHSDIKTTMIYVRPVAKPDDAAKLQAVIEGRLGLRLPGDIAPLAEATSPIVPSTKWTGPMGLTCLLVAGRIA